MQDRERYAQDPNRPQPAHRTPHISPRSRRPRRLNLDPFRVALWAVLLALSVIHVTPAPAATDDTIKGAIAQYFSGHVVDAVDSLTKALAKSTNNQDQYKIADVLMDVCTRTYQYQCLAQSGPRFVEIARALDNPRLTGPKIAYVVVAEWLLAGDVHWIEANAGDDFSLKFADSLSDPAFAARLYILNARLDLARGHDDAAMDYVSRAFAALLHIDTTTDRYDIAVTLTELIDLLDQCHDTVRAFRWFDITGRFIEATLSKDEFEYARFLAVKQALTSHFGDTAAYDAATGEVAARVARLQLPADQKDYWLADTAATKAAIAAVAGQFDAARRALADDPLAATKPAILRRGRFANREELLYALVETFVDVLANRTPDPRWLPLFAQDPTWPMGAAEAPVTAAYRTFASGLLELATDKARGRAAIVDAARSWLDTFERNFAASQSAFPLPSFVDRIAFGLLFALQTHGVAIDGDLLVRAMELLNRNPRYALSDTLAELSAQPTEEGRRLIHSALRLEDQQANWQAAKLKDLVARIAARAPFDPRNFGPQMAMAGFVHARERLLAAAGGGAGTPAPRPKLPSLAELQAALHGDEALLGYAVGSFGGLKICVRHDGLWTAPIAANPQQLRVDVKLLTAALTSEDPPSDVNDAQYPVASAVRLYHLYFDGLAGCTSGVHHLVFIPPTDMAGVPLAALLTDAPPRRGNGYDLGAAKWLFRDFDISYVTSVQNFISARRLAAQPAGPLMMLGVGDPRLHAADGQVVNKALADLDELPDTATELSSVAKVLTGDHVDLLLGKAATEEAVRAKPLGDYQVIEFATHGLIRGDLPGLSQAALVLTPGSSEDGFNDGLLTATEIANLTLHARVAVLSACNTANFDLGLLATQVQGLTSAFAVAGVPTTIASLWPVESGTSERLMVSFYTHLKAGTASVADALRQAMIDTIHDAPSPAFRHPRFWAPFIALGDGGARLDVTPHPAAVDNAVGVTPDVGGIASAVAAGGDLIASAIGPPTDGHPTSLIERRTADGKTAWEINDATVSPGDIVSSGDQVVAAGYAWTGPAGPTLRGISADGHVAWRTTLPPPLDKAVIRAIAALPAGNVAALLQPFNAGGSAEPTLLIVDSGGQEIARTTMSLPPSSQAMLGARLVYANGALWAAINGPRRLEPAAQRDDFGLFAGCWAGGGVLWLRVDPRTLAIQAKNFAPGEMVDDLLVDDGRVLYAGARQRACSAAGETALIGVLQSDLSVQTLWQASDAADSHAESVRRVGADLIAAVRTARALNVREFEPAGAPDAKPDPKRLNAETDTFAEASLVRLTADGKPVDTRYFDFGLPASPNGIAVLDHGYAVYGDVGLNPWIATIP